MRGLAAQSHKYRGGKIVTGITARIEARGQGSRLLLASVSPKLDDRTKLVCTKSTVQHNLSLPPVRRVPDVIPVDPAISVSEYMSRCLVVHASYLSVEG